MSPLLVLSCLLYKSTVFINIIFHYNEAKFIFFFSLLSHSTLPNPSRAHSSLPNRGEKNKTGETRKTKSPPSPMFWCILMLCCVFCSVFEALGTFLALSSLVSIASSCPLPFSESRPYLPWDLQYEIIPTG